MIKFKCLVNGTIGPDVRARVVSELHRIYAQRFELPEDALRVEFIEVAPGLWFTAGRPSDASMLLGSVPPGTTQAQRVALMDELARMFSAETGAVYEHVMVVAADARPSN
jgi:phenylpyruvate tautomerase PptA (4-oxalocrotonate tautomerase family)